MNTARTYHATAYDQDGRNLAERIIRATSHASAKASARRMARRIGAQQWTLEGPSNATQDAWAAGQARA